MKLRRLISCITSCGRCDFCRKSMYSHCRTGGWILGNTIDGTQAEFVRIPYADTSLYPLPAGANEEALVMLSDIFPKGQPGNPAVLRRFFFVFNGEMNWVEDSFTAVDYLGKQNWSGIGQRIYEQALVEEADLTRLAQKGDLTMFGDGVTVPDAAAIETMAWNMAQGKLVTDTVPTETGDHWGGDSDCSGQLH